MAARNWVTSICTALGVAVGAGAAQLGIGYGLNIVAWVATGEDDSRPLWLASLAWVAWLSANATIIGALCADRLSQRHVAADHVAAGRITEVGAAETDPAETDTGRTAGADLAWRCMIAVSAAIGALITVPLVAVPARLAPQANNSAPQYTAGGYAVAGVIVGLIAAVGVLSVRAIAVNVIATASWLWILAIAAVTNGLRGGVGAGTAQLATWQFAEARWVRGLFNLPAALLMLGVALIIGVAAAWHPGRRGDHRVGVALSGAIGPLLVATAYFLSVPGIGDRDQQLSAYVTAPYAVLAGLAGSVLVSALGSKDSRERARAERMAKRAREAEGHEEWQKALTAGESAETDPGTATGRRAAGGSPTGPASAAGSGRTVGAAKARNKLAEDAYAPARAYATDTVDDDSPPDAAGRASVGEPIWPEQVRSQSKRRKGR
jgi:hypothetical protein